MALKDNYGMEWRGDRTWGGEVKDAPQLSDLEAQDKEQVCRGRCSAPSWTGRVEVLQAAQVRSRIAGCRMEF